jgi:DNA-binding response OmpR family regulator
MNELNGDPGDAVGIGRHWKLVVADDMILNADSLSDVLRMMGHEVFTAYDGQAAIAAHESYVPDAYVLDLGMPGLDGFDTCRAIRQLPGGEGVAIVALSGWGRHDDVVHALEVGFSGFLLKPAHPRDILRSLSGLWSRKTPSNRLFPD